MKRIISLFLCMVLILSFTACSMNGKGKLSKKGGDDDSTPIKLPFSREEGINPYKASSLMNYCIMPLLYSGLYKVDANYNPVMDIATGVTYEGMKATVTLDTSRKFSNSRKITADDVVYSYNQAKKSTYYGSLLRNVTGCVKDSDEQVYFVTSTPNVYIAASLTFPIIPDGSITEPVPHGAGPYMFTSTAEGGTLTANMYYPNGEYATSKITLVNVTDASNLNIGLIIGNMDAMYDDLSSGKSQRIAAGSAQVDLNNLIYLKFNHTNLFANIRLRQAIAVLLDKEEILNAGFEGYGQVTDVPFNPQWFAAEGLTGPELTYEEAQEYLTRALGKYNVKILVSSDNMFKLKCAETVASQLAVAGISASVEAVPRAQMDEAIEAGGYDLYVAEFKMSNDMNIGPLLHEEDDLTIQATFFTFLSGNTPGVDFMTVFNENMPFIPLCIRYGVVSYSKGVQGGVAPLPNNPYANLMEWYL